MYEVYYLYLYNRGATKISKYTEIRQDLRSVMKGFAAEAEFTLSGIRLGCSQRGCILSLGTSGGAIE